MSDALSDIARDEQRGRYYGTYLAALLSFLEGPSEEKRKAIHAAAKNTDSVRGGYWARGSTNIASKLDETIDALVKGDKTAWARLLSSLAQDRNPSFDEFKKISPFKEKLVLVVDYGCGFAHIHGEVQSLVDSLVRAKRWKTYDADDYFIALDKPDVTDAEVVWLRCGISGVKGPRAPGEK